MAVSVDCVGRVKWLGELNFATGWLVERALLFLRVA
jgi:hypothetical protein